MVEATVQKRIAQQLPGLEIAAVQGPQCQLGRNVVQQKYRDTGNNDNNGNRWDSDFRQPGLLTQIFSPESRFEGYNSTMTKNNLLDPHHVKLVTVYASSSEALKPIYYDAARRTGEVLAEAGKSIIYGAGGGGLMGAMADGALSKNGKVFGVVPQFLQDLELTHRGLTELKIVTCCGDIARRLGYL